MGPEWEVRFEAVQAFATEVALRSQQLFTDDDKLFPFLNCALLGWALLVLLPRWRGTRVVTMGLVLLYSAMYAGLLVKKMMLSTLPVGAGVTSLEEVVALFSDR